MSNLNEQVAIITGASSGIGAATAETLAREGAKVVLAARREDKLKDLQKTIENAGGEALVVETDVTKRDSVESLAKATLDAFGRIDILVNNAGVMLLSFVKNLQIDEWEQMVDVNIRGVLFGVGAVLPTMMEQKSGHIVNVSSVAGRKVMQSGSVYSATKFAVTAFSEGLRQELSPEYGVRVTTIEPGAVATELTTHITDEEVGELFKGMQEMNILESKDIAEAILYAVASPQRVNVHEVLVMPTEQG